jgi:hypothetical protein
VPLFKKQKIDIVFTNKMTAKDLEKISLQLKKHNIKITYFKKRFDNTGHLQSIGFNVDCNDGFKGSAATDILTKKFGFIRDYNNKEVPFLSGYL